MKKPAKAGFFHEYVSNESFFLYNDNEENFWGDEHGNQKNKD